MDRSDFKRRLYAAVKSRRSLLDALEPVAEAGRFSKPRDVALWMERRIMRHIDDERSKKLRNWKVQRQIFEPWATKASVPTMDRAFHLVKIEHFRRENEHLPASRQVSYETIIKRARELKNDDVNALGKRAVQLLLGARRKPSRRPEHPVEAQAVAIVERINADWYPPAKVGRPQDAMLNTHFTPSEVLDCNGKPFADENGIPYKVVKSSDVRLTYEELVDVALPSILNLGPPNRELTVRIINALTAIAIKLDKDRARGAVERICDLDDNKIYSSIKEIAGRYMRRCGPPAETKAESDNGERAQLKKWPRTLI
jgi:hypothetical protein